MAVKLQPATGKDLATDIANQGTKQAWIGDAKDATADPPTYKALTGSFQGRYELEAGNPDEVLDLVNVDRIFGIVDYVKSAGTGFRLKALFGEVDDRTKITTQQGRRDNLSAAVVKWEVVEHESVVSIRTYFEITRISRFCRLQVKSLGTPDGNDKIAISIFGQIRSL